MRGYGKFKHHFSRITTVPAKPQPVNRANCLIEKLSEIDSLPHVRKLSEMPAPNEGGVSQREVNDERKKIGCEGGGGALPEGE